MCAWSKAVIMGGMSDRAGGGDAEHGLGYVRL